MKTNNYIKKIFVILLAIGLTFQTKAQTHSGLPLYSRMERSNREISDILEKDPELLLICSENINATKKAKNINNKKTIKPENVTWVLLNHTRWVSGAELKKMGITHIYNGNRNKITKKIDMSSWELIDDSEIYGVYNYEGSGDIVWIKQRCLNPQREGTEAIKEEKGTAPEDDQEQQQEKKEEKKVEPQPEPEPEPEPESEPQAQTQGKGKPCVVPYQIKVPTGTYHTEKRYVEGEPGDNTGHVGMDGRYVYRSVPDYEIVAIPCEYYSLFFKEMRGKPTTEKYYAWWENVQIKISGTFSSNTNTMERGNFGHYGGQRYTKTETQNDHPLGSKLRGDEHPLGSKLRPADRPKGSRLR